MNQGRRSQVAHRAVLTAQVCFLLLAIGTLLFHPHLGIPALLLVALALAGFLALLLWKAPGSELQEMDEAFKIAQKAIRQEAERLESRRAEIEKVLMAYGEWMEFPDFEEIHDPDWTTPARSEPDAEVAQLLDRESDRILNQFRSGIYWQENRFQSRLVLLELWDFMGSVARIYHPEADRPLLETNLEALLRAVNRASLQVILLLEELPLIDVKDLSLRKLSDGVRKASKVVRKYEDIQPYLEPVRYLWQGSKFLLASNPLLAAGWVAGSELLWKGGKRIGKRALDAYVLSLVRQTLGIIAWETASIYDHTHRFRNPDWIFAVELAHLVSTFPLTRDTLQHALRELGVIPFRSSYDRIFLYRCVAQHVSPKPERFAQPDLLTDETRRAIVQRLHAFFKKSVQSDATERATTTWQRGVEERIGVDFAPVTRS